VTLATNMAGRGVDILLGGNPIDAAMAAEVKELGGLHVIGTERHESRRIDNQLRGRAARQGDPGSTQFFVSLDDDLMRIFGSDRVKSMMDKLGIDDATPIESKMVTRSLEKAQQRVEGHHFDTRKHVLEYDDVLNKHRTAVYAERREVMGSVEKAHEVVVSTLEKEVERVVYFHTSKADSDVPADFAEGSEKHDWDPKEIVESLSTMVKLVDEEKASIMTELKELSRDKEKLAHQRTAVIGIVMSAMKRMYDDAVAKLGEAKRVMNIERSILLRATDAMWMQHLDDMTYLRRTIGLQGYAQRDPLVEYKREAFRLYSTMRTEIGREVSYNLYKMIDQHIATQAIIEAAPQFIRNAVAFLSNQGTDETTVVNVPSTQSEQPRVVEEKKEEKKPRPNDPCFCGSGKKFKKCHGA
jgi:preprotein translocase subunit SecA